MGERQLQENALSKAEISSSLQVRGQLIPCNRRREGTDLSKLSDLVVGVYRSYIPIASTFSGK